MAKRRFRTGNRSTLRRVHHLVPNLKVCVAFINTLDIVGRTLLTHSHGSKYIQISHYVRVMMLVQPRSAWHLCGCVPNCANMCKFALHALGMKWLTNRGRGERFRDIACLRLSVDFPTCFDGFAIDLVAGLNCFRCRCCWPSHTAGEQLRVCSQYDFEPNAGDISCAHSCSIF